MKYTKIFLSALLYILFFSSSGMALGDQHNQFIDETVLHDLDGGERVLSDYTGKGKWTVVMLWVSDCHVCNQEASEYDDFHDRHKMHDATMLGVSMDGLDGKDDAKAFIKRNAVGFPNLIGDPQLVASLFIGLTGGDWTGTPTFLVFSPSGDLKAAQAGAVPVSIIEEFIHKNSQAAESKM